MSFLKKRKQKSKVEIKRFILVAVVVVIQQNFVKAADEICFSPSTVIKGEKRELEKRFPESKSDYIIRELEMKTLFSTAYLKKFGLTKEDRASLSLMIKEYLSRKYINKLLQAYAPSQKELKSYYILHRSQYKLPFDKVKERVKRDMLNLKRVFLVRKEYQRLKEHEK